MIWDWIRGWFSEPDRNPTAPWPPYDRRVLELDLDRHQLNGVGVGDRWERLKFLGPGGFNGFVLSYPDRGLTFEVADDQIAILTLHFGSGDRSGGPAFAGELRRQGRRIDVHGQTTLQEFLQQVPDPFWIDDEEGDALVFYEFPGLEWQVEFYEGLLAQWEIRRPELDAPEARETYNVNRPWPPTFS